jgi:glycosyltransferase involved in cell wall biosynthesis
VPRGEFAITRLGIRRAFNSYARRFGRPDLVHAHCGLYGGVAALELKERFGIPFVLTEHSSGYEKNIISERMGSVLRDVLAAAERVVVVSAALSRSISPYCEEVIVIPNTVDTDFFANIQRKPSSGFQVVSVGSLKEVKGFDVLLEAFARLARDRQGVHLNIVGEGALLGDLKGLAAQLGISTIVTFHGQLSRADLGDLLSSANLYVSASRVETFGVAIAEAMSCGLPVVATSSGGSQDIVTRPELGVLVPVGDTESLAFEMRRAFDSRPDLDLERAVKARSAMVDQYGPQVIGDTLDDLYREVSRSLVC